MDPSDVVSLTRSLIAIDTINPPGREAGCARQLARLLEQWGFAVKLHGFADERANLVATIGGRDDRAPIVLTGHLDTVPLGAARWERAAFGGETDGDRLYGRGASDMKGGIAAMMVAARRLAPRLAGSAGLKLVLTAAEEGGCVGSRHLVEQGGALGGAGAIVVGEPTSNYPHVGHKGTIKFHARFHGVAAHGSMPHLGENAVYKAACAACRLQAFRFDRDEDYDEAARRAGTAAAGGHPVMGLPTLNVGTLHGGDTINSVPDFASMGVDIRTVAGMDHAAVLERVRDAVGPQATLDVFQDSPAVWTDPADRWVRRVFDACSRALGEPIEPRTTTYNTDAGNLRRAWPRAPVVVLGPGEAALAHQTDEWCSVSRLGQAVELYEFIVRDWCGL